ncbi:RagB/SusD family nutrient uptake outer membrane protein [Flavobacterium difficile]|uniref:RagB/SusD family nutrient uptake outer membrane protein n=1 Tax=Flavobacterium difficile TaxID=2709659 RepID=A0ABX0I531_9FLAO|nr:RagB/SusD family nutrient uptake outer membrane protein [Flavobacterium difficile]NHM00867.1 RagB/SusD family nutrient uptake outer membrane protein [Flavobacterium difficile]
MKKYFSLFMGLFLLLSCSDEVLDPFIPGVITDVDLAVRTSGDMQRMLNSAQNIMTNRDEYVFTSVFTDEAVPGFNNGGQGIAGSDAYYLFFLNPSSGAPANIWSSNLAAMARINIVLEQAEEIVPVSAADEALIKRLVAEAKILRALGHLKVMAYFSTDLKNDAALAGVIADRVFPFNAVIPRATNGDTYAFIHNDLDDAITTYTTNSLPAVAAASVNVTPSLTLARALKARAYAYKGDYANAEIFADQVISSSVVIAPRTQLATIFHTHTNGPTSEVIYKFKRTVQQNAQGANLHNGWVSVGNARNGSPFYEVSRSLYNALVNAPGTDARTNIIVRPAGGTTGSLIDPSYATSTAVKDSDILVPFKHGGAGAATATNGFNPDFIQVRISEMYFIKAEARANAGDFAGVATQLQIITNNRFTTPPAALVLTSAQQAWKAILDERRKELAFEGHRFIDIKRLYSLAGVTNFDRDPADYAPTGLNYPGANPSLFSFANNPKLALPIPNQEINANGSLIQNPGY